MRRFIFITLIGSAGAFAQVSGPLVTRPAVNAISRTLEQIARDGDVNAFPVREFRVNRNHEIPKATINPSGFVPAPYVTVPANTPYTQTATFQALGAPISANFEALGVGTPGYTVSVAPPDTTLGVSDTQVVQWVNSHIAVYDKLGNPSLPAPGFITGNSIWSALPAGSLCRDFNRGDPLVQYDRIADRWVLSQFAFNSGFTQNAQCIAVSQTSNALGAFNLYQYNFGTELPDYGKLGIWPDAYYITYNMFANGSTFSGGRACAYDRAAMIAGNASPVQVCFNSGSRFSYLPSDLDGDTLPPVGAPNYHISWDWAFLAAAPYTMQLTKFVPNFNTPANSTFTDGFGGAPFSFVAFDLGSNTLAACNDAGNNCVQQLGTTQRLDTLASRHMYRLVYRNFGTHDALLFTQTVDNIAGSAADLRWWEIRNPGANPPVVYQNSTFRPSAQFRWMGSAAFDKLGNIGIGYSASSSAINPAIRIAGRRRTDPKNLLRTEETVQAGSGSQGTNLARWGDYSTMQIDPANDCTFWYTTQYIGANGTFNWRTRIASFKFPNCN
ncbi:MAG: hypothetical protein ACKV2U_18780 [Bryobacteraceae bacterium]